MYWPVAKYSVTEQEKYKKIKSPCISVCKYNKKNYCIGCKRHMVEIFDWLDYSDTMRKAVMKDLKERNIDEDRI